jgi:hypothetical protein|tara:strand:- start:2166 stop:2426 length:261 start_codon:yes stop_codon:yes gene_type:complete
MFETWVLICAIGSPLCHTLVDEYGPYNNKKQCIERAYEIAVDLPEHMPDYEAVKYKCVTVKEDLKGKIKTKWHMKTDEQLYLKSTD